MNTLSLNGLKLKSDLSVAEILGHFILWFFIILCTFGIGSILFPFYMNKFILNHTTVIDKNTKEVKGHLRCELTLAPIVGTIVIYLLLTLVTLGIAYFVYLYKITTLALDATKIEQS
ncbi:DUF6693 family protein [Basilea psittacipulmonis]|uniref:DUF898 domain-containing protein n=1 Tax=Basilea psittacipulmonis DSM 24701 TaxID=1072685 RepID=A0A077DAL6_9BURK|nr:DUF6693 family protein [Basilea psittacipulmonis]AIL31935.1 hypothetical protein IX83_00085 [Basilea psittacipulmonis DSM 24701]